MQRGRKIAYIINPISGKGSKDSLRNTIEKETQNLGIRYLIYPSVANGDYTFLHDIIEEEKITDVVVVGGDGTVSQVVYSLLYLPIKIGIIPAGSGNGLAFGAGISKSPSKALKTNFDNKTMRVDGFFVNQRFACMLCGLGFDARIAHDFANQQTRGLATYIRKVFKNFFKAKTYTFEIELKEKTFTVEAYFISIANTNQFGNHFTIAPLARLTDGLLDVVIITEQSKIGMVYNTMLQVVGLTKLKAPEKINQRKGSIYFQTDKIKIINKSNAPMHIDGDPVETEKEITISIKQKCFSLLVNKNESTE